MKPVATLITVFDFTSVKIKSLTMVIVLLYVDAIIKIKSLNAPTVPFYFITINMKSLTALSTLFKFISMTMTSLTTLTTPLTSLPLK